MMETYKKIMDNIYHVKQFHDWSTMAWHVYDNKHYKAKVGKSKHGTPTQLTKVSRSIVPTTTYLHKFDYMQLVFTVA